MADYVTEGASEAGSAVTLRSGTASADTVQAGCMLILQNTSAASAHNVDLTISATWHGLAPGSSGTPGKRRVVVGTSSWVAVRVPVEMGDANGKVAVAIDGTAADIKFLVLGG
jgi:hypothetical protein